MAVPTPPPHLGSYLAGAGALIFVLLWWWIASLPPAEPSVTPLAEKRLGPQDAAGILISRCGKPDSDKGRSSGKPPVAQRVLLYKKAKVRVIFSEASGADTGAHVWTNPAYNDSVTGAVLPVANLQKRLPCALGQAPR